MRTRTCRECGCDDTDACPDAPDEPRCDACGVLRPAGRTSCRRCGAKGTVSEVRSYAGCSKCRSEFVARGSLAVGTFSSPAGSAAKGSRDFWKISAAVGLCEGAVDTIKAPVFHIVEQPGQIERMTETEVPTEYYYKNCVRTWRRGIRMLVRTFWIICFRWKRFWTFLSSVGSLSAWTRPAS